MSKFVKNSTVANSITWWYSKEFCISGTKNACEDRHFIANLFSFYIKYNSAFELLVPKFVIYNTSGEG